MAYELTAIEVVLNEVVRVLIEDQDIEYYCQLKYGKSPKIYVGIDEDNPPLQEDYPVIAIFSISRSSRGESTKWVDYDILIGVGVINEKKTIEGKKVIYDGFLQVEHLRELVETSLFGKIAHKTDVLGETASEIIFPLFRSDTKIRLSFVQTSRTSVK